MGTGSSTAQVEAEPIRVTKSIESGALPVSSVSNHGDLYILSKENTAMYKTGTGFAFVPHHTITSTSSSKTSSTEQETVNKTPLHPSQQDVQHALDASDDEGGDQSDPTNNKQSEQKESQANNNRGEMEQLQLSEMIKDEAGAERVFHVTVTPGDENPALGKYICFVNHKDSYIQ